MNRVSASRPTKHRSLNIRVTQETSDRLEELARRNERSVSAEVRRAIRAHLEDRKAA